MFWHLNCLLGVRVFANGPGDLGSISSRVIPKTQKMVLDASLLNTQHYKVEQSREGVAPSPMPWCSSYRKGSLRVTLDYGRQLYFTYLCKTELFEIEQFVWIKMYLALNNQNGWYTINQNQTKSNQQELTYKDTGCSLEDCEDTGCSLEDLPGAMDDKNG